MSIAYSYGSTLLHDGQTYFCQGIDLSWVPVTVTTQKVARLEGVRKTGESVDMRTFPMSIGVLSPDGTRATLERALGQIYQGLNQRGQQLVIHTDGRYFIGDCVNVQCPVDKVGYAVITCTFQCYQPFAFAAQGQIQTFTGQVLSGSPLVANIAMIGQGTVYSRPTLTLTNTSTAVMSSIIIRNLTTNTQLYLVGLTLGLNDSVVITGDPRAANNMGYTIVKNGITSTLYDFTGTFPILQPDASQWQIQAQSSGTPTITAQWAWTPLYLS